LGFVINILRSVQLALLAWKQNIPLSLWRLIVIDLNIKFYLLFMPGDLVGSGIRWYRLSQPNGKSSGALAAVAFNRLIDVFLIVFMGFCFLIISQQDSIQITTGALVVMSAATILFWFLVTRLSMPLSIKISDYRPTSTPGSRLDWVLDKSQKLLMAFSTYSSFSTWEMSGLMLFGILRNLIGVASFLALALAVGIDISYMEIGWIRSIVLLIALLPVAVAGGLGVREVSLVALLATFGVTPDLALAFSLLLLARGIVVGLVGGILEAINVFFLDRPSALDTLHEQVKES
jgi:uncharacterized protein (TIRG00374 family)